MYTAKWAVLQNVCHKHFTNVWYFCGNIWQTLVPNIWQILPSWIEVVETIRIYHDMTAKILSREDFANICKKKIFVKCLWNKTFGKNFTTNIWQTFEMFIKYLSNYICQTFIFQKQCVPSGWHWNNCMYCKLYVLQNSDWWISLELMVIEPSFNIY